MQHRGPGASFYVACPAPRACRIPPCPVSLSLDLGAKVDPVATTIPASAPLSVRTSRSTATSCSRPSRASRRFELASTHSVEAILLDLYMPGLTGWETLQRLRDTPATADIPVVILSVLSPDPAGCGTSRQLRPGLGAEALQRAPPAVLSFRAFCIPATAPPTSCWWKTTTIWPVRGHGRLRRCERPRRTCRHPPQAIEQCLRTRPDLLILDLTLPDGDGFSLVDWLRQQPDIRSLPLVVYSGREVSDTEMSKLRLGPTQFLTKAKVQPQEVEELVLNIVSRLRGPASVQAPLAGAAQVAPPIFSLEPGQGEQPLL